MRESFFRPKRSLIQELIPNNIFEVIAFAIIFLLGAKFGPSLLSKIHIGGK